MPVLEQRSLGLWELLIGTLTMVQAASYLTEQQRTALQQQVSALRPVINNAQSLAELDAVLQTAENLRATLKTAGQVSDEMKKLRAGLYHLTGVRAQAGKVRLSAELGKLQDSFTAEDITLENVQRIAREIETMLTSSG